MATPGEEHVTPPFDSGAGEADWVKTFAIKSDLERVILEIPNQTGKGTCDAEMSSLRALLHEMEEEDVVDVTLNGHELSRAPACGDGASAEDSVGLSVDTV